MPRMDRFTEVYNKILNSETSRTGAIPIQGNSPTGFSLNDDLNQGPEYLNYLLGRKNSVYLDMLKDWDYVHTLINVYKEPIKEILSTLTNISVTINGDYESKTDYVNNRLNELEIIRDVDKNLDDIIYYGGRFSFLHHNKSTDKFNLLHIDNKTKVYRVSKFTETVAYTLESSNSEEPITISSEKGCYCSYIEKEIRSDTIKEYISKAPKTESTIELINNLKSDTDFDFTDPSVSDSIKLFRYSRWTSNFENQAYLLFKIWLYELFSQLLTSKDSIKQDVILATFSETGRKVPNIAQILQKIENVLNASANISLIEDPYAMISSMLSSFSTSSRVLPSIQETTSMQRMDLGDSANRRAELANAIDTMKGELIGSLGIPPELLTAGLASRWDILSRSDKFLNEITTYLNAISYYVRSIAASILKTKGANARIDDIEFNIMNSTGVQSQLARVKVTNLNEELMVTTQILQNLNSIMAGPYYDPEKLISDFKMRCVRDGLPFSNSMYTAEEILMRLAGENGTNQE